MEAELILRVIRVSDEKVLYCEPIYKYEHEDTMLTLTDI